jgi:outer membrane cobalamin receptor
VRVLTRKEIELSGAQTIQELLERMVVPTLRGKSRRNTAF